MFYKQFYFVVSGLKIIDHGNPDNKKIQVNSKFLSGFQTGNNKIKLLTAYKIIIQKVSALSNKSFFELYFRIL
jgi:hypothetical protein